MAVNLLPDAQSAAPPSADGTTLVLSGSAWGNTAYEDLIASAAADLILTGIVIRPVGTLFTAYALEVDIAVGAAGFEVPIATARCWLHEVFGSVGAEGLYIPTIIGIDAIPTGARVSTRIRASGSATTTFHISISYLTKSLTGTLLTTTQPMLCFPSAANQLQVLTAASPWATGAAVEIFDDSGPARAIVSLIASIAQVDVEWEVDLCTGPSADVATTSRGSLGGVSSYPNVVPFVHPYTAPALTSLSMQARAGDAGPLTVQGGVHYFEMPL